MQLHELEASLLTVRRLESQGLESDLYQLFSIRGSQLFCQQVGYRREQFLHAR